MVRIVDVYLWLDLCHTHCVKSVLCVNAFDPHLCSVREFCYGIHFADGETEAQRGGTRARCPRWETAVPSGARAVPRQRACSPCAPGPAAARRSGPG